MWYNLGIIICLSVAYCFLDLLEKRRHISTEKSKHIMIWIAGVLLALHSGLRNVAVGIDTYAYYLKFSDSLSDSWGSIFNNFSTVFTGNGSKDPGYYLIQKAFSTIIPDFQCFLFFIAVVFFISFFCFIDYYSNTKLEVLLAVIVYLSLFYDFFSITGCRQVLATAFCLFSVKYIRENKVFPFILIMLVAFTVHRSSIIFAPFYLIAKFQRPGYFYILALVLITPLISMSHVYAEQLAVLSGVDHYLIYAKEGGTGAKTFLLFYLIISSFLFIIQHKMIEENPDTMMIFNAIYLALFFIPLTYSSAALMRVVQYYSLFLSVGISFFLRNKTKSHHSGLLSIFLMVALFALGYRMISNNDEYKFFWQPMELPINY